MFASPASPWFCPRPTRAIGVLLYAVLGFFVAGPVGLGQTGGQNGGQNGAEPDRNVRSPYDTLLVQSQVYVRANEFDKAAEKLTAAIQLDPQQSRGYYVLAEIYERLGKFDLALVNFTRFIERQPQDATAFDRRGMLQFKLGKPVESVADFDKAIELDPSRAAGHWQRGISLYYAGRYVDGQKQFESYQTVDDNDVENAVWRFLCMARSSNFETAQKEILKIGDDRRVPMRQVYDMFAGLKAPGDVLAAAQAGNPTPQQLKQQMFYAYQYCALFAEARGEREKSLAWMRQAAADPISHYMGDVARVHVLLRDPPSK